MDLEEIARKAKDIVRKASIVARNVQVRYQFFFHVERMGDN